MKLHGTIGNGIMGIFTELGNALNAIVAGMQGLAQLNDAAGFVDDHRLTEVETHLEDMAFKHMPARWQAYYCAWRRKPKAIVR